MHAGVEMPVADYRILGIAGDEQDLEVGPLDPRGIGELAAIHPLGQADIGDQQIDPRGGIEDGEAGGAIARFDRLQAHLVKYLGHQHADRRLVIDHQHRLPAGDGPHHFA